VKKAMLRDLGLAIRILRSLAGDWSQGKLSEESGIDEDLISAYERGLEAAPHATMRRIAEAAGVGLVFFDEVVPICGEMRRIYERDANRSPGGRGSILEDPKDVLLDLARDVGNAVVESLEPYFEEFFSARRSPCPEDRAYAERVWRNSEEFTVDLQVDLVELIAGDEKNWALAEKLCGVSRAVEDPEEALRLARLAMRVAEASPGVESWRNRLLGWCEAFLADALRREGDSEGAKEAMARAEERWRAGVFGDPDELLDGARRPSLGSL